VVLGRRPIPAGAHVLDDAAETLLVDHRDPALALKQLQQREVRHVWLEGGPTVAAAFWRAGLVDEVLSYLAPALLGAGAAAVGDLGVTSLDQTVRLVTTDVRRLGDDVLVVARPQAVPLPDAPEPPEPPDAPDVQRAPETFRAHPDPGRTTGSE